MTPTMRGIDRWTLLLVLLALVGILLVVMGTMGLESSLARPHV